MRIGIIGTSKVIEDVIDSLNTPCDSRKYDSFDIVDVKDSKLHFLPFVEGNHVVRFYCKGVSCSEYTTELNGWNGFELGVKYGIEELFYIK